MKPQSLITLLVWAVLTALFASPAQCSGVWPYITPPPAVRPTCHALSSNIKDLRPCSNMTCGPANSMPPAVTIEPTADACCARCGHYQPNQPPAYGGLACNSFTWCAASGCGKYAGHSCWLKYLQPGQQQVDPPLWKPVGDPDGWVSGSIYSDSDAKCLERGVLHRCSEAYAAGVWRPDGDQACHCINRCAREPCAPGT